MPKNLAVAPPAKRPRSAVAAGGDAEQGRDYWRLFQANPTPLLVVEHEHLAVVAVNQAATRAFGYSEAEFLASSFSDFVAPEDRAALLKQPEPAPVPGLLEARSSWKIVRRDGHSVHAQVAGAALQFHGHPCAILFQAPDIEPGAQDVGRTGAALPEFSFSALHDLKEPLHLVKGYLSLLRAHSGSMLDGEGKEYLEAAQAGTQRMQAIVLSLLEYFRVDAKGVAPEPVDLNDALADAMQGLALQVREAGATITHDPLPRVLADRIQLGRVLQNLLSNAVKFHGKDPPRIHVSAEDDGDKWQVRVRDNGIGIHEKDRERVLQPFQRVHSTDQYPGTGLGLSISRKIIEMHGGHLWIESEHGRGTTIRFTLPRKEA